MRIGIDLGGTKIEGIVLAPDGTEVARRRMNTPQGDYQGIVDSVAGLISELEHIAGMHCSIGMGMPGSVSLVTGLIKNSNSVCLNGKPLRDDLEKQTGRKIRFANDADCFALSEAMDGAAQDAGIVFGVIIGTGTGGGIVVNGALLAGPNGIVGEWGHNPLPWPQADELPGADCYCGKQGCIETWLSGAGLAHDHERVTGESLSALEVGGRANTGNLSARETLERYADRLARSLASVINVIDPDAIVLGGGVSNIDVLYERVPALWGRYVFSDCVETRLVRAKHGDSSGVRGAAWLWTG